MAGHSKWSNIKRKKGKEDAKKGKVFTKHARAITVAAREGGGDPNFNSALKLAIDNAKADNMPNDNIDRAIKKGTGEAGGDSYEEVFYEGYGPGGVAVLVQTLTDNRNRTAPDVRHAFDKGGGNLGQSGCVSYLFDKSGLIGIERKEEIDSEELMLLSIELGALDFEETEDGFQIVTDPKELAQVRDGLKEAGYDFAFVEIGFIPQNTVALEGEDLESMEKLLDGLEDLDDVQEVHHNWEMED